MFYENILKPFFESVENYGENNAFCIDEKFYTYIQFKEYISKIRIALKEQKINCKRIALEGNDDIETYASIFALWFEGLCVVPLNPEQPLDRSLDVINQIGTTLILDSAKDTRYKKDMVLKTTSLIYEKDYLDYEKHSDEDLAYVLFTSGSTGKPKGVTASRSNLGAFVDSFLSAGYNITENDRILQYCNLTFDISIASYLPGLLNGACIYTVPNDEIKYSYIAELFEKHELTFAYLVPSIIRYLRPYFDEIRVPSMRFCLFGGEPLPLDLAMEWQKCIPNGTIINTAGPTEDTITDIRYIVRSDGKNKTYNGNLCIGKPLKNTNMMIIDEQGNEVEVGVIGELCLSGMQLTPGYWNNPERNKEQFFIRDGVRWYKSGDMCFYDEEKDIMIVGRLNNYVKVQGFRVELSEVEFHAKEFLKNKNVIAVTFDNEKGFAEIAMFFESKPFDTEKVINYMRSKMPPYMIPTQLFFEKTFPRNANNKIDRIQLKALIK